MDWTNLMDLVLAIRGTSDPSVAALPVLFVVGGLAYRFFSEGAPLRVRLVVFFTVVGFALTSVVGAYLPGALNAETETTPEKEQTRGAEPSAVTSFRWLPVVLARDARLLGWVYCGKYDREGGTWVNGQRNVDFVGRDRHGLPQQGDELTTRKELDVYDDQPRYTIYGFKWTLGSKTARVPAGRSITVLEDALVIGGNVWCRVSAEDK